MNTANTLNKVFSAGLLISMLVFGAVRPAWSDESQPLPEIRVATLKFGTLNWELDTMAHQHFDEKSGFRLKTIALASMTATRTALMSRSADVIVADWIWVSQQRNRGIPLQFIPYSSSIGKLMVPKGSAIESLADLKGKRIGIAGGPADKGWLLLRAGALQQGFDLKQSSQQQFAAPPLLNAALERGQIDAVLTFWHYAARLEGKGHRSLLDLKQISAQLGLDNDLPMLGLVFHQQWAQQYPDRVKALQAASMQSKYHLRDQPDAWQRLRPLMGAKTTAVFERLKAGYLAGIPTPLSAKLQQQAQQMFTLLAGIGGSELMGKHQQLDPDTFWSEQQTPTQ
ncbi:MAG: ABC transporter substrate-binding protein [Motiliproteus sp.]